MGAALAIRHDDERPVRLAGASVLLVSERFCFWDDAREAELRRLFIDEGLSQGAIAKRWNIGKGAISAKLDRLGIKRAKPVVDGRRSADRATPRPSAEIYRMAEGLNLTLVDLAPHGCRWPTGHDGEEHLFCGLGAVESRSYCAAHLHGPRGAYQRRKVKAVSE